MNYFSTGGYSWGLKRGQVYAPDDQNCGFYMVVWKGDQRPSNCDTNGQDIIDDDINDDDDDTTIRELIKQDLNNNGLDYSFLVTWDEGVTYSYASLSVPSCTSKNSRAALYLYN